MGWADCGTDSNGRPIGYAFAATCDHPGCNKEIDRGLSYACGPMHGSGAYYCELYFCEEHQISVELKDGTCVSVCLSCYEFLKAEGELKEE